MQQNKSTSDIVYREDHHITTPPTPPPPQPSGLTYLNQDYFFNYFRKTLLNMFSYWCSLKTGGLQITLVYTHLPSNSSAVCAEEEQSTGRSYRQPHTVCGATRRLLTGVSGWLALGPRRCSEGPARPGPAALRQVLVLLS